VNMQNWILGNYVVTVQLLVLFAEVIHEDFLLCSCVFIFVCDVQLPSVFSMVACVWFVSRLRCTHLELVQFTRYIQKALPVICRPITL
jgi:hypothetical protein